MIIGTVNIAKELRVSRDTIYRYCRKGMPYIKLNNRRRAYELNEVISWLKNIDRKVG